MAISMAGRESVRREEQGYGIYFDEPEMLGK